MGREKKRGTSGNAKAFISRPKALKKLQLTLTEFRRLCILKGVYPRNPRKKLDGSDKTYYLRKDVDFLAHERLITTLRQEHAHNKKVVKARAKKRIDILKRLALNAPRARLDHLVVERYPHFHDAIRELDDPLCIIALFANLPAERRIGVSPYRVSNCQRLMKEFCHYVTETQSLKRVFASIKGYYFQAKVCGINVTWVTPHRFTQNIPDDVDFTVMLNFLELYECILSFVNFRLYTEMNLAYPPKLNRRADAKALELGSLIIEKVESTDDVAMQNGLPADDAANTIAPVSNDAVKEAEKIAMAVTEEEDDEEDGDEEEGGEGDDGDNDTENAKGMEEDDGSESDDEEEAEDDDDEEEEAEEEEGAAADKEDIPQNGSGKNPGAKEEDTVRVKAGSKDNIPSGVFAGKSIVLGREVPFMELQFSLKASGALRVTRQDDLPEGTGKLKGYTHWIIDRPSIVGERDMSLEYVQPQYVFDSINASVLLPATLYAPGAHLPPHLSPFLTAEHDGGYRPWFQGVLERIKSGDTSVVAEAAAVVYAEGEVKARKAHAAAAKGAKDTKDTKDTKDAKDAPPDGDADIDGETDETDEKDGQGGDTAMGDNSETPKADEDMVESASSDEDEGSDEEIEEEENDSEGEEDKMAEEKKEKLDKEEKDMATLMLSRKKLRKYKKIKGQEQRADAAKRKLASKRQKLEAEREDIVKPSTKKRKKNVAKPLVS